MANQMQKMSELRLVLKTYQDEFLFSQKRFPAIIAGWATGKTMLLLLKAWNFCHDYPNQYVWFIRKEFIDLQDSTMRDFQSYFNTEIPSDRNYICPNKSVISFRHGGEVTLNNLKNANLSAVFIEQGEEFETDECFQMLRGRIRNKAAPYNQICIAANTAGHNWLWKLWKNTPPSKQYHLIEANSYHNKENIPKETLKDWEHMKTEAPNQYNRYVMNSWEETAGDDFLFTWELLNLSRNLHFPNQSLKTIIGVDTALFGEDRTAYSVIRDTSHGRWEQFRCEAYEKKDSSWIFGHYVDLRRQTQAHFGVVDADGGYGDGTISRCKEAEIPIFSFHAQDDPKPENKEIYADRRAESYFLLKEMMEKQLLKIVDDHELIDELLTIRFTYRKGKKAIVSKTEMRKGGTKSPDKGDSLAMAISVINKAITQAEAREKYTPARQVTSNAGFGFKGGA